MINVFSYTYLLLFFLIFSSSCTKKYYEENEIIDKSKFHGKYKVIDKNGNVSARGKYLNGIKNGKWYYYHDNYLYKVLLFSNSDTSLVLNINLKYR